MIRIPYSAIIPKMLPALIVLMGIKTITTGLDTGRIWNTMKYSTLQSVKQKNQENETSQVEFEKPEYRFKLNTVAQEDASNDAESKEKTEPQTPSNDTSKDAAQTPPPNATTPNTGNPTSAETKAAGNESKDHEAPEHEAIVSNLPLLGMQPHDIALLMELKKRSDEIERQEKSFLERQAHIEMAERELLKKMEELQKIKKVVEDLLMKKDEQSEQQIQSLVKIYENMKPKEAAEIFNTLEINILLDVIGRMSVRKTAPILSQMDPKRAQVITEELANRANVLRSTTSEKK